MNLRWARDIPLKNANLAIQAGVTAIARFLARRRAIRASGPVIVSTSALPSGGTNAVARINSRTLDDPSFVATPGTVSPAIECPTRTISSRPASSMSATTDSTKSAMVSGKEVAGFTAPTGQVDREHSQLRCQPMDFVDGESQQSAASPPPWTRTNAGSATRTPSVP